MLSNSSASKHPGPNDFSFVCEVPSQNRTQHYPPTHTPISYHQWQVSNVGSGACQKNFTEPFNQAQANDSPETVTQEYLDPIDQTWHRVVTIYHCPKNQLEKSIDEHFKKSIDEHFNKSLALRELNQFLDDNKILLSEGLIDLI
ncbi:hypothetical protein [Endozoicomonas sp.]|uniref:hypothetical protein n=1 Tax=Endozoicomonas sp. TaxID=1892382 RepID=UPI0028848817|nr:hypothetical protein [Endozoicomonas sp.]